MDGQVIKTTLGKSIKLIRTKKKLTQEKLAEKAEISTIFLSTIERGSKFPHPDILAKIAQALEVEVFELFKGELVPSDSKEVISNITKDMKSKINEAIEDIIKQYIN